MSVNGLERRLPRRIKTLWDSFVDPREPWCDAGAAGRLAGEAAPHIDPSPFRASSSIAKSATSAASWPRQRVRNQRPRKPCQLPRRAGIPIRGDQESARPADDLAPRRKPCRPLHRRQPLERRQQEIVRRADRDGKVFLRFFPAANGALGVRSSSPGRSPPRRRGRRPGRQFWRSHRARRRRNAARLLRRWPPCRSRPGAASQANVDAQRSSAGCLSLPSAQKFSAAAEKLLRNMSTVAESNRLSP